MKEKILIIGASGHGKVIADIAERMEIWKEICFLDDNDTIINALGFNVIGKSSEVDKFIYDYDIFPGIGDLITREKVQQKLELIGANIPVLIHPRAIIGKNVVLNPGTVIMGGAIINCCSLIGKGSIVNTGATIDHDCIIDDYVNISPGVHIAGTVNIGRSSFIGIGSIVSNNVNITRGCVIGAGAVVVKDILEAGTYVGVPARRIR